MTFGDYLEQYYANDLKRTRQMQFEAHLREYLAEWPKPARQTCGCVIFVPTPEHNCSSGPQLQRCWGLFSRIPIGFWGSLEAYPKIRRVVRGRGGARITHLFAGSPSAFSRSGKPLWFDASFLRSPEGLSFRLEANKWNENMIRIMPAQRAQIEAAASTIHNINTRDLFLRQVAKVLECCASPVAPNDVTHALRICMRPHEKPRRAAALIPPEWKIQSASTGVGF
jgi:hypothetical protein